MVQIENLIEKTPSFKQITADLQPKNHQLITGISGSARTELLSALSKEGRRPILVVTDTISHMQELASDLENLLPANRVYQFPVEEVLAAEVATSSPNYRLQRVLALNALINNEPAVVVASAAGLRRNIISPEYFAQSSLKIKTGGEVDPAKIRQQLSAMGYQYQKMVLRPGDFAIRGSIIDIYALNTDNPVRIDLFDTEVDSLRYFDASTQRSIDNVEEVQILPATDFIIPATEFSRVYEALDTEYKR